MWKYLHMSSMCKMEYVVRKKYTGSKERDVVNLFTLKWRKGVRKIKIKGLLFIWWGRTAPQE